MAIKRLYLDFFKFLAEMEKGDPWSSFQELYLKPYNDFFAAYWERFSFFDPNQIKERVLQIKEGDYGQLKSLIQANDPALLAEETLKKCQNVLPLDPEPDIYLFVGFFSADGTTLQVSGAPAIALGLERFKNFRDFSLLLAHEYGHCALWSSLQEFFPQKEKPLLYSIISEGLAVFFSETVFPEIPLHRHLFLTPDRLRWCKENQETLLALAGADLAFSKLIPILFGPGDEKAGLPPRVGYFIARQMLGNCLSHHGAEYFGQEFPNFKKLFQDLLSSGKLKIQKDCPF